MDNRIKRAFWPFVVVLTGALAVLGYVVLLHDAQELLGWPLAYWLGGVAVLAIGALGWKIYDFQGQLDALNERGAAADAPPPPELPPIPLATGNNPAVAAITTLRREKEWAERRLSRMNPFHVAEIERFETAEDAWRWERVIPAMEAADVPRDLIVAFSDGPARIDPDAPIGPLMQQLYARLELLSEAIDEAEALLD